MNQFTEPENWFAPSPDEFPSPPRKVRLRWQRYAISNFVGSAAFVALFLCLGFGSPMIWGGHWFGVDVPGRISAKEAVAGGKRNTEVSYRSTFSFRAEGQDYTIAAYVKKATYDRVKIGDPVQVRVLSVWPGASASIEPPAFNLCPLFMGIVMSAFLIVHFFYALCMSIIRRNLIRNGIATLGRVTNKWRVTRRKRGTCYNVSYCYKATDGAKRRGSMTVNINEWDALQVGDTVTVLFNPNNKESSVIYRCAEFEIVGMVA
jgi:hypothetical protein